MTILITGGTGRVGSAAIETLLKSGAPVRCLSHSSEKLAALPKGVEPAFADLDHPQTLTAAFEGVQTALLSLSVHPNEEARGRAAIEAAIAAKVQKIVHVSLKHYPGSEIRKFFQAKQTIERTLARSPFRTITLRPTNFFQTDSTQKPYMVGDGLYPPPIGSVGIDRIDARDVGYAAAMALTSDTFDGQEAELYGPETYTGESVAALYTLLLGRPVKYMGDDIAAWVALNEPRLGHWYVDALKGLYEQQQTYGMLRPEHQQQHPLLPKTLRSLGAYATELAALWRQ